MKRLLSKVKALLSYQDRGTQVDYAVRFLDHTLSAEIRPGCSVKAEVALQNAGSSAWRYGADLPNRVELVLRWNGQLLRVMPLPQTEIPAGTVVRVPLDFTVPEEIGTHILSIDLVEQTVAFFEDRGSAPLHLLISVRETAAGDETLATVVPPRYGAAFLEHNLPAIAPAGSRLGAWFSIRNTGSLMWKSVEIDPRHPVDLLLELDGRLVATVPLPVPRVRTGETITFFFTVPLPEEVGKHLFTCTLIRQNDCFFAEKGVTPFCCTLWTQADTPLVSTGYFEKALQINSWFYMPSHGVVRSASGCSFPVFAHKAHGCTLWDTEGARYIDYTMGWGCNLLGYGEERVNAAVRDALEYSATLPLPHPLLLEVSEMLCASIPSAEMTAFGKNGSDVCALAVRIARVATGRRKVLICGYHGFQDWFAELVGFSHSGVPDREEPLVYRFHFNNYDDFQALLQCHRQDLAAVMLEPAGPGEELQGPSKEADVAFLRLVASETRKCGALLIFDEIITGFRYLGGSAQQQTGVFPDLTCLGKALGNGMPISALVGRRDLMTTAMPRSFYGPTFKDETLSLAAARASLAIYQAEPVSEQVWDFGKRMIREVNELCLSLNLPASMVGPAFRYSFHFQEQDNYRLIQLRTLYQQELIKRGVLTYNGIMLPSYAHDEQAYLKTMEAMHGTLETVKQAICDGCLHHYLEMPLITR